MPDYDWTSLNADGNDLTFLRAAIQENRVGDAAYAVNMYNFNMNFFPDGSGTPLCLACKLGRLELAKELVEWGADIHVQPDDEYTPLILAAVNGHQDVTRWLLESGVNPHHVHVRPESADVDFPDEVNAFGVACREERWAVLECLRETGVVISSREIFSDGGEAFLAKACMRGLQWLAEALVMSGVNPDARPDEYPSPLIQAVRSGNRELVEWLLQQGADPDYEYENIDHWGDLEWSGTAFTAALENGNLDLAMLLLDFGASPDVCGIRRASGSNHYFEFCDTEVQPVFLCIEKKWNVLLAKMLSCCDMRSSIFSADDRTFNPLSFAIMADNHDAALMLIGQGYDANNEVDGWTVVNILIMEGKYEFLPLLLDNGLDVLKKNNYDGEYIFVELIDRFPEYAANVASRLAQQLNLIL